MVDDGRGSGGRRQRPKASSARRSRRAAAGAHRYAAIDLGTHNCRLLIAEPLPGERLRVIEAMSRPVRLGEGLAACGCLGEAPMARTLAALSVFAARLDALNVVRIDAIATEACRRAANVDAFLARAAAATGLAIRVIDPAEEAALTLKGCAGLLDPGCTRALLFDIGGGSTEVTWAAHDRGRGVRPLALVSLPIGVVELAERYGSDRVGAATYQAMTAEIAARLAERVAAVPDGAGAGMQMLGTSGTVTTLAALHLGLGTYDRNRVDGVEIDFAAIAALSARLVDLDRRARAAIACIGPDRADLVVAGCAFLEAICRRWPVGRLTVADRGIREGLLLNLMAEDAAAAGGVR